MEPLLLPFLPLQPLLLPSLLLEETRGRRRLVGVYVFKNLFFETTNPLLPI